MYMGNPLRLVAADSFVIALKTRVGHHGPGAGRSRRNRQLRFRSWG